MDQPACRTSESRGVVASAWPWVFLTAIGVISGAAAGLDVLAGMLRGPVTSARIVAAALLGAAGMSAVLLAIWRLTGWLAVRLDIPLDARRSLMRRDLLCYLPALVTLAGAWGVQFIAPVIALIVLAFLAIKSLVLRWALTPRQRTDAASSMGYLALLFLISGFAALIYQIVWQRALFTAFGVNIESITIIVSLFMFGLGIGSMAGGLLSRAFPDRAPLLFLICELGIGAFGIVSLPLIRFVSVATLHGSVTTVSLAIFALLCLPTALMGATLPILVGHLCRHYRNVGKSVGILYCINTLGSAIACFLTADLLFVVTGLQGSVLVAAACNAAVGVLVMRYARAVVGARHASPFVPTSSSATRATHASPLQGDPGRGMPRPYDGVKGEACLAPTTEPRARHASPLRVFVLFFAAACGYISLSQEMLWMRAVSYLTGGDPSVFAHVLGFFLIGVAGGAYFAEKVCDTRLTRPGASPVRFVGLMLLASALFYYLSIPAAAGLFTYCQPLGMAAIYGVVAVVSFLLGGIFPVLCHYHASAGRSAGVATSHVYMANIAGSTLGPLLTGFVLMDRLPTDRIALCLSLATLLLGGAAFLFDIPRRSWPVAAAAATGAALIALHGSAYDGLLEKLHFGDEYASAWRYKYLTQNRSGIIAVTSDPAGHSDMLYGGGVYDGNFNIDPVWNSNGIRRAYAIAALHPDPRDVLEIGLASGSWASVISLYAPVTSHTIIEINPGYLPLIAQYSPQQRLLSDPAVHIHIDDGRRWLNRNPEARFDLILQNTTWHWRSQITNLLSAEYLQLCQRHLRPGGVAYLNTTGCPDVARTVAAVFQHVVRYENFVAASDAPCALTPEQIRRNLAGFALDGRPIFRDSDPAAARLVAALAQQDWSDLGPSLRQRCDLWRITDDNMANEYKLARWRAPEKSWSSLHAPRRPEPDTNRRSQ